MKTTSVGGTFCAAHKSPEGVLHGHSYEVWASWRNGDARDRQDALRRLLEQIDHTELVHELTWGEGLAEWIGHSLPGCIRVRVKRPLEMIEAEWWIGGRETG
jgi:6-pyruvoyl-tetrahydropterin synthase